MMRKLIAIICVVSWSGFWAFGYLAISANIQDHSQLIIAAILAFVGLVTGMAAYLALARMGPALR